MSDELYMREAVELARGNVNAGGLPFGAVLVRDGKIVARAVNEVHTTNDPTAHAEMQAIRQASHMLATPDLRGAVMYASGHPCPMCFAAMHRCGIRTAYFAYSNEDASLSVCRPPPCMPKCVARRRTVSCNCVRSGQLASRAFTKLGRPVALGLNLRPEIQRTSRGCFRSERFPDRSGEDGRSVFTHLARRQFARRGNRRVVGWM